MTREKEGISPTKCSVDFAMERANAPLLLKSSTLSPDRPSPLTAARADRHG
jgi:hypothetical protein